MGPKKKASKPPPPPEPLIFQIENLATVETREDSLTITPNVVTPQLDQAASARAAEEEKTCGQVRIHIERNDNGKPEYQIHFTKPGDPDSKDQDICEDRQREKRGDPIGWKKPLLPYALEEHGLPEINAITWMKDPLTFPVLNEGIDFRKIKTKRQLLLDVDSLEGSSVCQKEKKKEQDVAGTSKGSEDVEKEVEVNKTENKEVEKDQVIEKKTDGMQEGHVSALDIWSSQRMLNEFMIYTVQIKSNSNFAAKDKIKSSVQATVEEDLLFNQDAQEEFIRQSFLVTDKLTGKEISVDPTQVTPDDNGYFTIYDSITGDNFVIDPPKMIVLDPITQKELVIDPRKPVGQYYSVEDPQGNPIELDTSDQQPYIYKDPVSGASLLVDDRRVKPYTVRDPRSGAEVRINPLTTDGKPYVYMDGDGVGYSILPVIPGGTPVLFNNPSTGDPAILGGPVMIRDPVTGEMKFQEGAFTMRDPKTGQNMNQIGPILVTNQESGQAALMSNPSYVKHPHTGELTMGPSIVYKIQHNGKLIPTLPESERDKAMSYMKNTNMLWDESLGTFIKPEAKAKIEEIKEIRENEKVEAQASQEKTLLDVSMKKTRSIDSILDNMTSKSDRKRIKKFVESQIEEQREMIRELMSKKKELERSFLRNLLMKKEKSQSLFVGNLMQHFGVRLKYYEKAMFASNIKEKVMDENKALASQLEKKLVDENNRALDAMLIQMDQQKHKLLEASNMKGTVYEFYIGCKSQVEEFCDHVQDPSNTNKHLKRTLEVYKTFKARAMQMFNESLERENELIRREMKLCLDREMEFIQQKVDELYVKICCQRFLVVK